MPSGVHGIHSGAVGFSGGWVWRDGANRLRAAGHEVFTPTLTGLGERAHLANPEVTLAPHIQDVIGVRVCNVNRPRIGHSARPAWVIAP